MVASVQPLGGPRFPMNLATGMADINPSKDAGVKTCADGHRAIHSLHLFGKL